MRDPIKTASEIVISAIQNGQLANVSTDAPSLFEKLCEIAVRNQIALDKAETVSVD